MGLFSGKTIISVASTVYNMAGPEKDRSNFLKSNLFAAVMSPHDKYLGETIVQSYLNGPGLKQRQFFNWAKRNDYSGMPTFTAQRSSAVDTNLVQQYVPLPASAPAGADVYVQTAEVVKNDIEAFARRYILDNDPDEITKAYQVDYDSTGERILITYYTENDTAFPISLYNVDSGYDPESEFVVANFYVMEDDVAEPVNEGTLVTGVYDAGLPDDTGFTVDSDVPNGTVNFTLNTTTTWDDTFSDGRPDEQTVSTNSSSTSENDRIIVKSYVEYLGGVGTSLETESETTFHNIWQTHEKYVTQTVTTETTDVGGGVTRTRTITTDGEALRPIYDYRVDTQITTHAKIEGDYVWIYKVGDGIVALDALVQYQTVPAELEFFPFIPLRLDNVSVREEPYLSDGTYEEAKSAYRKVSNGEQLSKVLDEIEENEDIDDIDYTYMMFGVSANVKEEACRKYMYHFLKDLSGYQNVTGAYMAQFESDVVNYNQIRSDVQAWIQRNDRNAGILPSSDPRPEMPTLSSPETTTIQLKTDSSRTSDLDIQISWVSINEEEFVGVATKEETTVTLDENDEEVVTVTNEPAKAGDIWFEKDGSFDWQLVTGVGLYQERGEPFVEREDAIEKTYLYWQVDSENYKRLTIYGLIHQNFIYGGKSVDITLHEALDDPDTSGFVFPLNIELFKSMGIVDYTQMATANSFLIFNSYDVVKQKWYQSFFGMLLIIVLVVASAAIIAPGALAGAGGILGTNAAIGTAAGLAGTSAVVAGAVANAIVGAIVGMVVSGLTADLGFIGELIGYFINFALSGGLAAGGLANFSLSTVFSPGNLLKLSSALANGYAGMIQRDIMDMNQEMIDDKEAFDKEMQRIQDLINELGGSNDLQFNPMSLTDVNNGNGSETGSYLPESLNEFIHRTTMTGSDIVEITLSLVHNHADLSLTLPKT